MTINHDNLKEDSPQKICEALAVCFVRVRYQSVSMIGVEHRHTSTLRRDVSIIADAHFCLANDALALGLV